MKKTYYLVYQAGIANVFEHSLEGRKRIKQWDFKTCENFCRGLRHAGKMVKVAWCNMAGDIINQPWETANFSNAPFNESFPSDFVTEIMK